MTIDLSLQIEHREARVVLDLANHEFIARSQIEHARLVSFEDDPELSDLEQLDKPQFREVTELDLFETDVTPEFISYLRGLPNLSVIDAVGCSLKLSDYLEARGYLPALRTLKISPDKATLEDLERCGNEWRELSVVLVNDDER